MNNTNYVKRVYMAVISIFATVAFSTELYDKSMSYWLLRTVPYPSNL